MKRPVWLFVLLVALPLALLLPGARELLGGLQRYRLAVLLGLPLAAGLLAALLLRPRRGGGSRRSWLGLLPLCAVAFLADWSFLGVGYRLEVLTLTYGNQPYFEHQKLTALWALPLCLAAGVLGWETALRGALYGAGKAQLGTGPAALLSVAAGTALSLPGILGGSSFVELPFAAGSIAAALGRELGCLALYSAGGLLLAGLYRGVLFYFELFVMNDWNSLSFPAWNFVSSDASVYALRALSAALATAILGVGCWLLRRRSPLKEV